MLTTKFIRHFSEGSLEFIKNYDVFFISQIRKKKKVTHIEKNSTEKSYFSSLFIWSSGEEKSIKKK